MWIVNRPVRYLVRYMSLNTLTQRNAHRSISANAAAFAAGVLFFLTYFPAFFLRDERYQLMSRTEKMAAGLLSNVAMAFGVTTIMLYEGTGNSVFQTRGLFNKRSAHSRW